MRNILNNIVRKIVKWIGIGFLSFVILVAILVGYLDVTYHQRLTLPSPTGTYRVGRTEYDWIDTNRIDPLSNYPNEKRELLVWFWYPADVSPRNVAAPYLPSLWVDALDQDRGIAGKFLGSKYSTIQTHSFANVPLAGAQIDYPVTSYSPAWGASYRITQSMPRTSQVMVILLPGLIQPILPT